MKQLLTAIVFVVVLLSPSAFCQMEVNGNNWIFEGFLWGKIDPIKTKVVLKGESQIFSIFGDTQLDGIYYIQVLWTKDLPSYPRLPDTLVVRLRLTSQINAQKVYLRVGFQDSNAWSSGLEEKIALDSKWQEIKFNLMPEKEFFKNLGRIYFYFSVVTTDSCYTGVEIEVDELSGKLNGVVEIYDAFNVSTDVKISPNLQRSFALSQNYPNPFNSTTKIRFILLNPEHVNLVLFNFLGQEIQTLVSEEKNAGTYEVSFDASSLPSGVYFYRPTTGSHVETRKMSLLK